jgi:hypothetical protein
MPEMPENSAQKKILHWEVRRIILPAILAKSSYVHQFLKPAHS